MTATSPNIEHALYEGIKASHKTTDGEREGFWASSIGSCIHKQVAQRAGLPPTNPPDKRAQFKMWTGSVMHHATQKVLADSGYLDPTWTEALVTYGPYRGKLDGMTYRINGGAVVEVKTCDDRAITRFPDMPASYLWQGFLYCLATKISTLLIFQLGRNQGIARHRRFELDDEWRQTLDTHIKDVEGAWADFKTYGKLPPHKHNFPWEDRMCAYNEPKEA